MASSSREHLAAIRLEGGSRVVALTHFLPKKWKMVKVSKFPVAEEDKDEVVLRIRKVA